MTPEPVNRDRRRLLVTRILVGLGVLFLLAFVLVFALGDHNQTGTANVNPGLEAIIAVGALVLLIAAGNSLYGRNSPYAKADARTRPAQRAKNQAIDEARRAQAAAAPAAEPPAPPPPAPPG